MLLTHMKKVFHFLVSKPLPRHPSENQKNNAITLELPVIFCVDESLHGGDFGINTKNKTHY